jgi:hypothetical protein
VSNPLKVNPNPKFNYLESKQKTKFLIDNIKRYYRKHGFTNFDVWSERERVGKNYIWVVRSNLANKLYNL